MTDRLTDNLPSKDGPGTFVHHKRMNPAASAPVIQSDAEFLSDLAARLFKHAAPMQGFDQGDVDRLYRIARTRLALGEGEKNVRLPIDRTTAIAIQKAAEFLDAAAGEGLEVDGLDAMDIVTDLHELLDEDARRCFHEDVALWLRGKIRPTIPEAHPDPLAAGASEEREGLFWIVAHEPGMVPERKGPWKHSETTRILREFIAARPTSYLHVLTIDSFGHPQVDHGPEILQMLDGRSMGTGRKHNARTKTAHLAALSASSQVGDISDVWRQAEENHRTYSDTGDRENDIRFLTLGLTGEAGEVANFVKKRWRDGDGHDEAIRLEIADVCAYAFMLASTMGMSPADLIGTIAHKQQVFIDKMRAKALSAAPVQAGEEGK